MSVRGALRFVLVVQMVLAGGLLARDFLEVAPTLALPARAPAFDAPVAPGDQTRRFAPVRRPFRPGTPVPGFDAADMPSRLLIEERPDGRVRLTGEIVEGDADRFAEWLAGRGEAPLPEAVLLHSPGGSVSDAIAIGRALRMAGLATTMEAGAVCLSACPYMLAGGVARTVSRTAKVGVHQHYYGEQTFLPAFLAVEDIQRGQAAVVVYLDDMGIDLRLMAPAMATPPEDIYLLLPDELRDYRLATEILP